MAETTNQGNRDRLPPPPPVTTFEENAEVMVKGDTTPGTLRLAGAARVTAVHTGNPYCSW